MGGQPGGLPIRTTFQLWSSLVLVYVYSTISLVSAAQVLNIQRALLMSVNKLAGSLSISRRPSGSSCGPRPP